MLLILSLITRFRIIFFEVERCLASFQCGIYFFSNLFKIIFSQLLSNTFLLLYKTVQLSVFTFTLSYLSLFGFSLSDVGQISFIFLVFLVHHCFLIIFIVVNPQSSSFCLFNLIGCGFYIVFAFKLFHFTFLVELQRGAASSLNRGLLDIHHPKCSQIICFVDFGFYPEFFKVLFLFLLKMVFLI